MSVILQEMQSGFRYLLEANSLIDVFLKVDHQFFGAHRCLLSAVSYFFRNLLNQQSYSGFDSLPVSLTIEGMIAEEMDLLLACLYGSLSVEDAAKMDKLDALQKAAQALQCPSVIEACQNISVASKDLDTNSLNALNDGMKPEDILPHSSNPSAAEGVEQWLDGDNIAAYEVTEYDPSVDEELVCHTETESLGPETANDNESQSTSMDLQSLNFTPASGSAINLDSSEIVLNLPQDAIRIINDRTEEDSDRYEPIRAVNQGLSKEFLSGIVCMCGRGRAGQTSACHQVPAAQRNMRLYACRCPCFRAGLPCNDNCRCKGCSNPNGLNPHMFPPIMKRMKEQKVCYCGYKQSQSAPLNSQARLCIDTAKCLCARSGRSCSSTCRCRCCANPHGQRMRQPNARGMSSRGAVPTTSASSVPEESFSLPPSTNEAVNSARQCCRCPSIDPSRRSGKFTSGVYCSQPKADREMCQKLGLSVKCQCLLRDRTCAPSCVCHGGDAGDRHREVRRRGQNSEIPLDEGSHRLAPSETKMVMEKWSPHSVQRNFAVGLTRRAKFDTEELAHNMKR